MLTCALLAIINDMRETQIKRFNFLATDVSYLVLLTFHHLSVRNYKSGKHSNFSLRKESEHTKDERKTLTT